MSNVKNDDGTVTVTFTWNNDKGECYDCGLPAAFFRGLSNAALPEARLCAVCAANAAADGEDVRRLT